MSHRIRGAALILLLASPLLHAAGKESASYSKCMKTANTTADMTDCSGAELKVQDARLNKAYKAALAGLEVPQQGKLRDAQRQWIAYRDANCAMYYTLSGGTIDLLNGAACELDMTNARADELENLPQT